MLIICFICCDITIGLGVRGAARCCDSKIRRRFISDYYTAFLTGMTILI